MIDHQLNADPLFTIAWNIQRRGLCGSIGVYPWSDYYTRLVSQLWTSNLFVSCSLPSFMGIDTVRWRSAATASSTTWRRTAVFCGNFICVSYSCHPRESGACMGNRIWIWQRHLHHLHYTKRLRILNILNFFSVVHICYACTYSIYQLHKKVKDI